MRERYRASDFVLEGVEPDTLAIVPGLGQASPDYGVSGVTLFFVYGF